MIELNCSYEESKKILELGYDFSKVCDRFFIKQESCGWGEKEEYFFRMNDLGDIFPLNAAISTYDEVWYHGMSIGDDSIKEVTPIIPKAALEACLPREIELDDLDLLKYVMDSDESLSYSRILPSISGECLKYEVPKKGMFFNSAFEAFLWVHEYYPEELKKKFDEVMA